MPLPQLPLGHDRPPAKPRADLILAMNAAVENGPKWRTESMVARDGRRNGANRQHFLEQHLSIRV
jgi:hypothetical protein